MPTRSDPHAERLALDRDRAAEPLDRGARDERPEIPRIGAGDDRRGGRRSPASTSARGRSPSRSRARARRSASAATASAPRARPTVTESVSTIAPVPSTATRSSPRRCGKLESVGVERQRVVPPGLDPSREPELIDQERHLRRGLVDHLDESRVALAQLAGADEGLREPRDRRERRPQVVAGEHDQGREAIRLARARPVVAHVRRAAPRRRTRCSVPARSRRRFPRCRYTIAAAATAPNATTTSGYPNANATNGSATAVTIEETDG